MDSGRLQPALLGGLFIGVLSALPIINIGNCCCCLWVVAGGVLAVYLRQQNLPFQIQAAEGALMGLIAGALGGLIGGLLSIPINMMMGPMQQEWMARILEQSEDMPPEAREMLQRMSGTGMQAAGIILMIIIDAVFGLLGGLLGVAIFKKNTPPPPPPAMPPVSAPYSGGPAQ